MKNLLIASFDMEIGGVERSLISMLENFDYYNYKVDLMLYRHKGDFMNLLTDKVNILEEISQYTCFRKSIGEIFKDKEYGIGISRLIAKTSAGIKGRINKIEESGIYQMQYMWKYAVPLLPKLEKEYDVAISYLWPHYFIADKVKAKIKIAWIHTDYSNIETDVSLDLKMWDKFNYLIAVSEECKNAFLMKYPSLEKKIRVIENITSPELINKLAKKKVKDDISKDNNFKILSVARFSHAKGIDNAVKALKLVHEKGLTDIKWYVVGYGGDEEKIVKLISENKLKDSFILLGKKTNPYPYMKSCDLYVQPSRYEGKAVTVREAQILGKAVMITRYTTSESQVQNGIDGCICELSVEGIVDGIEKLYRESDIRREIANNCSKTDYSNRYELNKMYSLME